MTVRVAVLGLASFYGPAYAHRAADHPDAEVVAALTTTDDEALRSLGRPIASAFAETYDCPVFGAIDELLDSVAFDAAIVATPTDRRADDAVAVLGAGHPVLTAKPAADGETGARRIADAVDSTGSPALTTCPARFDDGIGTLAARIDAGEIGEVVAVRASIRHDRAPIEGIEANAEHAPDQAGAIYAMGYYTADALCWLADARPRRTFAEFDNVNTPHSEHPDIGTATVRFANGVQGTMTVTYSTDCRERLGNWEVEVVGTDGIGRTTHTGYEGVVWHGGTPEERSVEAFARTQSPVLDRQFATFVDAARLAEYPDIVPRPEAVTEALALCDRWEESVQSGEAIDW